MSGKTTETYLSYVENLLESIDLDILVMDGAGTILVWNQSLERRGLAKEEVIGRDFREVLPQFSEVYQGRILGAEILDRVVARGEVVEILRYPMKSGGEILVFDLKAYPVRVGEHEVGAVVVMTDVTEKIRLEHELVHNARMSTLANLGASIAHEIRNPLNSISLNIQLIEEGLAGREIGRDELLRTSKTVLAEIRRLNGIIRNFLEFARPPRSRIERTDLAEIIRHTVSLLAEEARKKRVVIETFLDRLDRVPVDRGKIAQAIYNIALNAVQASPEGGRVEITARTFPTHARIDVSDTGSGIRDEDRACLFDLFFSTRKGGSGLGLSIAHRIVEEHGGRLTAENNLGRGALFSMYLPAAPRTETSRKERLS